MNKCFTALLLALNLLAEAQDSLSRTFALVSPHDFHYVPDDLEEPAVVLFDIGETKFVDFDGWYLLHFTRTKRVLIRSSEGQAYAKIEIPYYLKDAYTTEIVEEIEGYTYNFIADNTSDNGQPNIEKVALDRKSVYEETINANWRKKVLAMPQAKAGSIIDIKYTISSPFFFNLPDWKFQTSIPTVYSAYTAKLTPFYEYAVIARGAQPEWQSTEEDQGMPRSWRGLEFRDMVNTWVREKVPAFKDESYITNVRDYRSGLDFQLSKYYSPTGSDVAIISTWPKLNEELLDHESFGKYIKKSKKLAASVLEAQPELMGSSPYDRAQKLIAHVKETYSWNHSYGKYASQTPKSFESKKTGNAGDINLYLTGLLQEAGLQASPVIISTRDHGKIFANYPFSSFFNYTIVFVNTDNGGFLADATANKMPFNRIPTRCINEQGLIVQEDKVQWLDLYSSITSLSQTALFLSLNPETAQASCQVMITATEFEAVNLKNKFSNDSTKVMDHYLDRGYLSISNVTFKNYEHPNRPYTVGFESENRVNMIADRLLVKPFLDFPMSKNQLTQKERSYPIDFTYAQTKKYSALIKIPEGYRLLKIPESHYTNNSLMTLRYQVESQKSQVSVQATAAFKKAVYQPNEYAQLKKYMDTLVRLFNMELVLEKSD